MVASHFTGDRPFLRFSQPLLTGTSRPFGRPRSPPQRNASVYPWFTLIGYVLILLLLHFLLPVVVVVVFLITTTPRFLFPCMQCLLPCHSTWLQSRNLHAHQSQRPPPLAPFPPRPPHPELPLGCERGRPCGRSTRLAPAVTAGPARQEQVRSGRESRFASDATQLT